MDTHSRLWITTPHRGSNAVSAWVKCRAAVGQMPCRRGSNAVTLLITRAWVECRAAWVGCRGGVGPMPWGWVACRARGPDAVGCGRHAVPALFCKCALNLPQIHSTTPADAVDRMLDVYRSALSIQESRWVASRPAQSQSGVLPGACWPGGRLLRQVLVLAEGWDLRHRDQVPLVNRPAGDEAHFDQVSERGLEHAPEVA